MLEKVGISAETARMGPKADSSLRKPYQDDINDFPGLINHYGIQNFDPKNRLIALRTVGSLKKSSVPP